MDRESAPDKREQQPTTRYSTESKSNSMNNVEEIQSETGSSNTEQNNATGNVNTSSRSQYSPSTFHEQKKKPLEEGGKTLTVLYDRNASSPFEPKTDNSFTELSETPKLFYHPEQIKSIESDMKTFHGEKASGEAEKRKKIKGKGKGKKGEKQNREQKMDRDNGYNDNYRENMEESGTCTLDNGNGGDGRHAIGGGGGRGRSGRGSNRRKGGFGGGGGGGGRGGGGGGGGRGGGGGTGRRRKRRTERCFGYFECRNCGNDWASAYIWRIIGTPRVVFRQQCQDCMIYRFPYRTEYLKCSRCGYPAPECICSDSDPIETDSEYRPHRKDLCERCQTHSLCRARHGCLR